jgi:flagellar biosynthesis protein FlhF
VNRLLFTKLDETVCVGNVFNTVYHTSIPMSYFTTGQSVPDDIEVANSSRLVTRLFEGSFV